MEELQDLEKDLKSEKPRPLSKKGKEPERPARLFYLIDVDEEEEEAPQEIGAGGNPDDREDDDELDEEPDPARRPISSISPTPSPRPRFSTHHTIYTPPSNLKASPPRKYDGSPRIAVRDWLFAVNQYFKAVRA